MKTLAAGLQAHLDTGTTTLCWCWRLTRSDGVVHGFTDHDTDLTFDGTTFKAASGFTASEIASNLGLAVDDLSAAGALSSDAMTEADLAAGFYDNAELEIFRVNWSSTAQRVVMRKGNLGEVKRGKAAFTAEVRGLAHILNQTVGRSYANGCDADLGDSRCTIDLTLAAFKGTASVVSAIDNRRFTASGLGSFADGWFSSGKVLWASGANHGRAMEVKRHSIVGSTVTIELWQSMSEAVAAGNGFTVTAGCDKQFSTCKTKFSNGANFRGFNYMPGNDSVLSYPGQGENLDGGSRYGN